MIDTDFEITRRGECKVVTAGKYVFDKTINDRLSIMNINLHSVNCNFAGLINLLSLIKVRPTIIVITESWLCDNTVRLYNIPGYKKEYVNRPTTGGGILLFYAEFLSVTRHPKLTGIFNSYESLCISLKGKNIYCKLLCVYRPPKRENELEFIKCMEALGKRIIGKNFFCVGDINLCNLDKSISQNSMCLRFNRCMTGKNFENTITEPTFFSYMGNASMIDHTWSNSDLGYESFVFDSPIADHCPTLTVFLTENICPKTTFRFRDFSEKNIIKFREKLPDYIQLLKNKLSIVREVNDRIGVFDQWIDEITNENFPIMTKTVSYKRVRSPWITTRVVKLIRKKFYLFKLFRQNQITYHDYAYYANKLKELLKLLQMRYHRTQLKKYSSNIRKKWNYLNAMAGRTSYREVISEIVKNGVTETEPLNIASNLNQFFKEIPSILKRSIHPCAVDFTARIQGCSNSIFLKPITRNEVMDIVKNMKKSSNMDHACTKLLNIILENVADIIAGLLNECIQGSTYPDILKVATVTPLHKGGDKTAMNNYRPISTIPRLGKIFEKAISQRIYDFIVANNVISNHQFGFMKKRSTVQAAFELVSNILPVIANSNKIVVTIMVDFSKAFDSVEVKDMLPKLHIHGVRGEAYDLMVSYMSNRKQKVRVGHVTSGEVEMTNSAIAQGSSLGPLLYILFSNDLCNIFEYSSCTMYADDLALTCSADSVGEIEHKVNSDLNTLSQWCRCFGILVNKSKTKYLVFNCSLPRSITLRLDGDILEEVSSMKYLGIILDSKLKFDDHVKFLTSKLSQINGVIFRISGNLDLHAAFLFYNAYIYATVNYGIEIWGGRLLTYKCNNFINQVERATKNLFGRFLRSRDVNYIRTELKLMRPDTLYKFRLSIFYYKSKFCNFLPPITLDEKNVTYELRQRDELRVPKPKNDRDKINYVYNIPKIWNQIPVEIKESSCLGSFKSKLKSYLLLHD